MAAVVLQIVCFILAFSSLFYNVYLRSFVYVVSVLLLHVYLEELFRIYLIHKVFGRFLIGKLDHFCTMVLIEACRFTQEFLLAHRSIKRALDSQTRVTVTHLRLHRRSRRMGVQANLQYAAARCVMTSTTTTTPGTISTISGYRPAFVHRSADSLRPRILIPLRRLVDTGREFRVGLLNAQSVGNKAAIIQQWILDKKLHAAGLVETWHEDATSPALLACMPSGFQYLEAARPRSDLMSLSTNRGWVCFLFDKQCTVKKIQLPSYTSFECICAYLKKPGFNSVFTVLYRPGSASVTNTFFSELSDLLENLISYATSLVIIGDFNIHVDISDDPHAKRLTDIILSFGLTQHVCSPTHVRGHTLDLVITRTDLSTHVLPVDPPMLSDHSSVVLNIKAQRLQERIDPQLRQTRRWRSVNENELVDDLLHSALFVDPPVDVDAAFQSYEDTLRELLDKHAPLTWCRVPTRRSACWFDADCHAAKKRTRQLERRFRRLGTDSAKRDWQNQFEVQRSIFQSKFNSFWLSKIETCGRDSRLIWRVADELLCPSDKPQTKLINADDMGKYFRDKVSIIRAATASCEQPEIIERECDPLTTFETVSIDEVTAMIRKTPARSCCLDPIPSWFVKKYPAIFCSSSLPSV